MWQKDIDKYESEPKIQFAVSALNAFNPLFQPNLTQLLRYVNRWDHFTLGIEIVFFCFIFYYIIEEILEIVHTGWECIFVETRKTVPLSWP